METCRAHELCRVSSQQTPKFTRSAFPLCHRFNRARRRDTRGRAVCDKISDTGVRVGTTVTGTRARCGYRPGRSRGTRMRDSEVDGCWHQDTALGKCDDLILQRSIYSFRIICNAVSLTSISLNAPEQQHEGTYTRSKYNSIDRRSMRTSQAVASTVSATCGRTKQSASTMGPCSSVQATFCLLRSYSIRCTRS